MCLCVNSWFKIKSRAHEIIPKRVAVRQPCLCCYGGIVIRYYNPLSKDDNGCSGSADGTATSTSPTIHPPSVENRFRITMKSSFVVCSNVKGVLFGVGGGIIKRKLPNEG